MIDKNYLRSLRLQFFSIIFTLILKHEQKTIKDSFKTS